MTLKYIMLGMLAEPTSGYDLKKEFDSRMSLFWYAHLSQIYPTLAKMEKEELIVSKTEPSPIGPTRKIYSRTQKGRRALLRWLSGKVDYEDARFSYGAQTFFLSEKPDEALRIFSDLKEIFQKKLAKLKQLNEILKNEVPGFPDNQSDENFYPYLTLRMGFHKLSANIAWCVECMALIEKQRKKTNRNK